MKATLLISRLLRYKSISCDVQKKEITFHDEIIPLTSLHKENLTNTQPYLIIKLIILLKNISRRNT